MFLKSYIIILFIKNIFNIVKNLDYPRKKFNFVKNLVL